MPHRNFVDTEIANKWICYTEENVEKGDLIRPVGLFSGKAKYGRKFKEVAFRLADSDWPGALYIASKTQKANGGLFALQHAMVYKADECGHDVGEAVSGSPVFLDDAGKTTVRRGGRCVGVLLITEDMVGEGKCLPQRGVSLLLDPSACVVDFDYPFNDPLPEELDDAGEELTPQVELSDSSEE